MDTYKTNQDNILSKNEFDELESIKEDSNIYFDNAPAKKLPYH